MFGIGLLALDPDMEGLHGAAEHPSGVRVDGAAEEAPEFLDFRDGFGPAADRTGDEVAVAAEVFRSGIYKEVRTVLKGALKDGSEERVVHDGQDGVIGGAVRLRPIGSSGDAPLLHRRVCRCFEVDDAGEMGVLGQHLVQGL